MSETGLAYIGKIIDIQSIPGADFIVSATVICGKGGRWKGIIQKDQLQVGSHCYVYLPDALVPPSDQMRFREKILQRITVKSLQRITVISATGWRVRMCRKLLRTQTYKL